MYICSCCKTEVSSLRQCPSAICSLLPALYVTYAEQMNSILSAVSSTVHILSNSYCVNWVTTHQFSTSTSKVNFEANLPALLWYKFSVSTNLTEQISRRFPGKISRKIQDMFALLRPATQCTESTNLPKYRTKTWYAQHGAVAKIKKGWPVS